MMEAMAVLFTIIMGQADKDNKDMNNGQCTMDKIKDVNEIKVQSLLDVFFAPPVKSCSIKSLGEKGNLQINKKNALSIGHKNGQKMGVSYLQKDKYVVFEDEVNAHVPMEIPVRGEETNVMLFLLLMMMLGKSVMKMLGKSENDNTITMMPPVVSLVMLLLLLVSTEDLKNKKYPINALKMLVPPVKMLQNPLANMKKMTATR